MKMCYKILVLGDGRISRAIAYFCKKNISAEVQFLKQDNDVKDCDILIAALPGELGEKGLSLALKYKKPLLDISDLDPEFYLPRRKEIEKQGISVIPGCGFCPGLVNFILGREVQSKTSVKEIEVKAGSLSYRKSYFPFLWCFEDLTLEHRIPSWQIISKKKVKFPAFAGYKQEKFFGIDAESYYSASGFENLLDSVKVDNFVCRVVRPKGFKEFYLFFKNYPFLDKKNFLLTKSICEGVKEDNYSLAEVGIIFGSKKTIWQMYSFSKKKDKLNSMQKITASVPAAVAKYILEHGLTQKGLIFMEDLAKDDCVFTSVVNAVKKDGVILKRRVTKSKL